MSKRDRVKPSTSPTRPDAPSRRVEMRTQSKGRRLNVNVSEKATPSMREIGGSEFAVWDESLLHRTMMASPAYAATDGAPVETYPAALAGLGLLAFAPKDPVEAMIASQAVALHFASLECARRAMLPQQNSDVASRLRKDAANLSRAMVDMSEALDRRRGKGTRQTVRVERVIVNEGGQAVVGHVAAGTPLPASPPAPRAIGQDAPPMAMLDAEQVAVRQGEGECDGERDV